MLKQCHVPEAVIIAEHCTHVGIFVIGHDQAETPPDVIIAMRRNFARHAEDWSPQAEHGLIAACTWPIMSRPVRTPSKRANGTGSCFHGGSADLATGAMNSVRVHCARAIFATRAEKKCYDASGHMQPWWHTMRSGRPSAGDGGMTGDQIRTDAKEHLDNTATKATGQSLIARVQPVLRGRCMRPHVPLCGSARK